MNHKNNYIIILILICYFLFLFIDLFGTDSLINYSVLLKYLSIMLCFLNTLLIGKNGHDIIDTHFLQFALFLALFADLFLLILNKFIAGISIFCFIQTIYIVRHSRFSKLDYKLFAVIGTFFIGFLTITNPFSINLNNEIIVLAAIYSFLTICSLVTAFGALKFNLYPKKAAIFILLGVSLLLMCDINVLLFNSFGNPVSGFLMWFFYLPSQFFLSMSGRKNI